MSWLGRLCLALGLACWSGPLLAQAAAPAPVPAQQSKQDSKPDNKFVATPEERRACLPDVQNLCEDVMGEPPATIAACLEDHRDKLSRACRGVLDKRRK
jgi:hypothetical protein